MHRLVYQVYDHTSCSIEHKGQTATPLLQLAAEFRFGSGWLAGRPRQGLTASG